MHAAGSGLSLSPSQGRIGMKFTMQVSLEDMACMQQILRGKKVWCVPSLMRLLRAG